MIFFKIFFLFLHIKNIVWPKLKRQMVLLLLVIRVMDNWRLLSAILICSCSRVTFQIVLHFSSFQSLSCVQLCDPMNHSPPGLPVHHQLLESTQTQAHWVGDAIQPSHPLSSPSPALNLAQHQGLFKWVSSSHQVAKVLKFQLQRQSFQWTLRTDIL